jgi:hypothetical protein
VSLPVEGELREFDEGLLELVLAPVGPVPVMGELGPTVAGCLLHLALVAQIPARASCSAFSRAGRDSWNSSGTSAKYRGLEPGRTSAFVTSYRLQKYTRPPYRTRILNVLLRSSAVRCTQSQRPNRPPARPYQR